jgi:hypothetical protein
MSLRLQKLNKKHPCNLFTAPYSVIICQAAQHEVDTLRSYLVSLQQRTTSSLLSSGKVQLVLDHS